MRDIRPAETLGLSALSLACIAVLVDTWRSDGEPLYASLAISGLAFAFSYAVILWTGDVFLKRGYKGRDMSKKNPVEM
jgi:UDP-N-acetylglucosamine--dolichyl-phosphate N-acetylglucosaminephosphotransferase